MSGENPYSFAGSPIGNLDLWKTISDIQINPNGTQIIFSDFSTNKIRKIDFSTGLCFHPISFHTKIKNSKNKIYKDSISTIAGDQNGNFLSGSFFGPSSIAIDWINSPEIIYVTDFYNSCIIKINQTSSLVSHFAGNFSILGYLSSGYKDGPLLSAFFNHPNSIRYLSSSSGTKLLIADQWNCVIRMIDISLGIFFLPENKLTK